MSDTVDSDRMPAEVGPEAQVDAALRAALGAASVAVHRARCGVRGRPPAIRRGHFAMKVLHPPRPATWPWSVGSSRFDNNRKEEP
jgi:hypothetical protein